MKQLDKLQFFDDPLAPYLLWSHGCETLLPIKERN